MICSSACILVLKKQSAPKAEGLVSPVASGACSVLPQTPSFTLMGELVP